MSEVIKTDVLIIGAGPAGLMAANEFQKRNVNYICLEKRSGPTQLSKALGIQARSVELLEFLGIHELFLRRGYPGPGMKMHLAGREPSYVELNHIKSRYPYLFILPQNEIEELFIANLAAQDAEVYMEHEVIEVKQSEEGVFVTALHHGVEKRYFAKYALACDGVRSQVRHYLDVPFIGADEGYTFFTSDVEIPGLNEIFINMHLNDRGAVALFPYKDGTYRVVGMDRARQGKNAPKEMPLEALQESLDRILDVPYRVEVPQWIRTFETAHRQVPDYRVGNVFFLGDAAHVNNPLGGQGMNLGLEDASNICWKMDLVLKGYAKDSFLASYNEERYPIAKEVIRDTTLELKAIEQTGVIGKLRNWAGKAVLSQNWVQPLVANYYSHIHHEYHKVKRNKEFKDKRLSRKAIQAGQRVPDQKLFFEGKSTARLYPFVQKHEFVCLIYIDCYERELIDYAQTFKKLVESVYPGMMKVFVVARGGTLHLEEEALPIIYDVHRHLDLGIGMEKGSTLILRPDGHVLFHDLSMDAQVMIDKLGAYFQ